MNLSDAAFIASIVVIMVAIVDWRRGKTGLGRMRLTKKEAPDKFWYAIVLYINMAIGLFWLSGNVSEEAPECDGPDDPCVVISESNVA